MVSILMMSMGIPMLSAGQDFLRSKHGVNNTYQRGDLNALNYKRLLYYTNTHRYFRRWIELRRGEWGSLLRLPTFPGEGYLQFLTAENFSSIAMIVNADGSGGSRQMLYAVNPHMKPVTFTFPEGFDPDGFYQIADSERIDFDGLVSACVPLKDESLTVPAMTCVLYVRK